MNTPHPMPLRILVTTEASRRRDVYFPPDMMRQLDALGHVTYHDGRHPLTASQLAARLHGVDVCITHWGCPTFTPEVLQHADRLQLIAHGGGSVGDLVTPEVFARGITVTSANSAMSANVAEGVLAYVLADVQRLVERAMLMREGGWLPAEDRPTVSLSDATIGLVGFGGIARHLVDLLAPLAPHILVSDPYVSTDETRNNAVEFVSLERLLERADIVSLHAALTSETHGLIDSDKLRRIRDGALLVNTARAGLVDGRALERELATGRIRAVLDVFDVEPLAADSPLRSMPNVTLMPHAAGSPGSARHSSSIVEEVARFARGEKPLHPVTLARFTQMTRDAVHTAAHHTEKTTLAQETP